jgi:hypothetical protein
MVAPQKRSLIKEWQYMCVDDLLLHINGATRLRLRTLYTRTLLYSASKKGYALNNEGRYNLVLHLACSGSYYDITYDV